MSGYDDLFGLGDDAADPVADPTPQPKRKAGKRTSRDTSQATAEETQRAAEAAADARAAQQRMLEERADALADLHRQVAESPPPAAPVEEDDTPKSSPRQHVIDRWNRYLGDPQQITRLGLPAGSRGRADTWGLSGVRVRVKVPAGTRLGPAAKTVADTVAAWGWGAYTGDPHDAAAFTLTRQVVGDDPAAPWRAAGKTALAVWSNNPPKVRRLLFEKAGLTVKKPNGGLDFPTIVDTPIGPRGPEILIDLPAGLSAEAAARTAPVMARLFRCPSLAMTPEGVRVRIELRTKAAATFPKVVPLEPTQFWRPTTQPQRCLAAPHLTLPVGVTASGEPIMVPLAKRPHTIIAGSSGAGKSRTLLTIISALALQGAAVCIGQFKLDPDIATVARSGLVAHYSDTLAGISRLVMWLRDELDLRTALTPLLSRRGIDRPVWEPVVVIIDEWGQGLDELANAADRSSKGAAAELVNTMSKIFAQGRSFGLHVVLSTQHAYSSAVAGRVAQNAATRIIIGKPKSGPRGHIESLFTDDKETAWAAADGIVDGLLGRGIIADDKGKIQQFQAFFGYTPGEPPETAATPELRASWERMRDALDARPVVRRFGWQFPLDGSGEWQSWSLWPGDSKTGPLPTVADLDAVLLDDDAGNPIPAHRVYDPFSDQYDPGAPLLNPGHVSV